jgi:hypothetical protein
MSSKTRSLKRGIAHNLMSQEEINHPNVHYDKQYKQKVPSYFSIHWREYLLPDVMSKLSRKKKEGK